MMNNPLVYALTKLTYVALIAAVFLTAVSGVAIEITRLMSP